MGSTVRFRRRRGRWRWRLRWKLIWNAKIHLEITGQILWTRRLHFYFDGSDGGISNKIESIQKLEGLCIRFFCPNYNLPLIVNLKELTILYGPNPTDMEVIANSFMELERVSLNDATYNDILPFIRQSWNLKEIKVFPKSEDHFNGGILELMALNIEREKLQNAQKLTIFVPENIFLKTKWATE